VVRCLGGPGSGPDETCLGVDLALWSPLPAGPDISIPVWYRQAWVEARKASDFSKFAPFLQTWVDLNRCDGVVVCQGCVAGLDCAERTYVQGVSTVL
jgi:hypothetical protein